MTSDSCGLSKALAVCCRLLARVESRPCRCKVLRKRPTNGLPNTLCDSCHSIPGNRVGLVAKGKRRCVLVSEVSLVCLGLDLETPWLLATDSNRIIELASELPEAATKLLNNSECACYCLLTGEDWQASNTGGIGIFFWSHIGRSPCKARGRVHIDRSGMEETWAPWECQSD